MKKRWVWIAIIPVIAICVSVRMLLPERTPEVKTTVLTPSRVEHTVSCNGVVEAVDGVGVFAPVTCRIREVRVLPGQRVAKGDVLAVIDKEATLSEGADISSQVILAGVESELVAPEDGIVTEVSAETGKTLKLGTPCAVLVRSCDLRVRIAIREKDLRTLREGMAVRISGDGLEQHSYSGVLTEIASTASAGSSVTMVAGLVTPDEGETDTSFRLGLTAKASVITSVTEAGYLLPYEAVLADEKGSYFYVLKDGIARLCRVSDGIQTPHGWLLSDESLAAATVILEPEKVYGDGATVAEAGL